MNVKMKTDLLRVIKAQRDYIKMKQAFEEEHGIQFISDMRHLHVYKGIDRLIDECELDAVVTKSGSEDYPYYKTIKLNDGYTIFQMSEKEDEWE